MVSFLQLLMEVPGREPAGGGVARVLAQRVQFGRDLRMGGPGTEVPEGGSVWSQ